LPVLSSFPSLFPLSLSFNLYFFRRSLQTSCYKDSNQHLRATYCFIWTFPSWSATSVRIILHTYILRTYITLVFIRTRCIIEWSQAVRHTGTTSSSASSSDRLPASDMGATVTVLLTFCIRLRGFLASRCAFAWPRHWCWPRVVTRPDRSVVKHDVINDILA
jgi:hypothetical protein